MAVRPILEVPDARLRQPAAPVRAFDAELRALAADLCDTLGATGGIGLSAPQLGVGQRIAVADLSERTEPFEVYVNPEILSRARWGLVEESCLSVPGVKANVIRATRIRIRAQTLDGTSFERDLEAMHAVCLQHETDHLDGRLFIDRLSWLRRRFLPRARLGTSPNTVSSTSHELLR